MSTLRWTFTKPETLVVDVRRFATDVEPWLTEVTCNVNDFVEAGMRGTACRIPVSKPLSASADDFRRFTHPLSPERIEELADSFRRNTHIIELTPDWSIPRGRICAVVPSEARP